MTSWNEERTVPEEDSGGTRVTMNLRRRAVEAVDSIRDLTGENRTDAVNRALQVYAYIQEVIDGGGAFYVRPREGGELEKLHFL